MKTYINISEIFVFKRWRILLPVLLLWIYCKPGSSQNPVAWYPFNGNANDVVGSAHGSVNGSTLTTDRFGIANRAYHFNGSNSYIVIGNSSVFNFSSYTVSLWFRYGGAGTPGKQFWSLISKNDDGNGFHTPFHLMVVSSTKTMATRIGIGDNLVYLNNPPPIDDGNWHQTTVVCDNANDIAKLFLDGQLISIMPVTGNPYTNTSSIYIGYWEAYFDFFNGDIDEVKLYNVALTEAQVQEEYLPGSGNSLSFDGIDDFFSIPTSGYTGIQTYTIEFWLKSNSADPKGVHVFEGSVMSSPSLEGSNSNLLFYVNNASSISTGPLDQGKWYHIACCYDKVNQLQTLYVNGILMGSKSYNAPDVISSTLFFMNRPGWSRYYNGVIDEIRIWNIALNQTQVRERMCRKITGGDPLYNNLVACYHLDETAGNTIYDETINMNTGALVGGPPWITSSAPIGNESAFNYVTTGLPSASLSYNGQDNLSVTYNSGTYSVEGGTQVYVVNRKPNTENGIAGAGSNDRYFGVFPVNLTSPSYTATYNYNGNPFVTPDNESSMVLFKRENNSSPNWSNANGILNTTDNTFTVTGQSTEYDLGMIGNYRSVATGEWSSPSTWEHFNGAAYVPATTAPGSPDDGSITIRSGHAVTLNIPVTTDQISVEAGASLVQNANLTLANGAGDDLTVNGTWTISGNQVIQAGFPGCSVVNNGTMKGNGTISLTGGMFSNNGILAPGSSPGLLTFNGNQPLSAGSTLAIEMNDGLEAGTGHDQLIRNGNLTLAGTLSVTETGIVPNGTYTIVNLTSGLITGNFNTVNLPAGYSLQINSNTVDVVKADPSLKNLNLSLLLEGLYDGGSVMHKVQDWNGDKYHGTIADQIAIELHDAFNYPDIIYSSPGINLGSSGSVATAVPASLTGSYYLTVRHRNSIETTSSNPVPFSGNAVNYDYTTSSAQAFGDNLLNWNGTGVYVLWGGDVNQDGIVDGGDMNPVDNASTAITFGYVPEDVNGDGIVDGSDMNTVDNNSTAIIMAILP